MGLTGIMATCGGWQHSLFLKNDSTVWAVGYNNYGQLGDGTTVDKNIPIQIAGATEIVAVAAGSYHSLFLKNDGTVWSVGSNDSGQLGDGTTINKSTPVQVVGLTGIIAIAGGISHSLFLKNDGTVWAVGSNLYGQLGDGTTISKTTPVQVTGLCNVSLEIVENGTENINAIYPNPCNNQLFIELSEYQDTSVGLYNLQGQLLQSIMLQTSKTILPIDYLSNGIYLVQLKSPKGVIVKKIVKN
jgi:alpha-tubulin suppressor-like RCC1 family protein